MAAETKRQNFNITPEQESEIAALRDALGAPTTKDVVLRAVRVLSLLAHETQRGHTLHIEDSGGRLSRLLIPELETARSTVWRYLVERPHPWRRQLYVKGRRLPAARVWRDMQANDLSPEAAADNWDLPPEAVREIVRYCQENRALLDMEAEEEQRRLQEAGVALAPAEDAAPTAA